MRILHFISFYDESYYAWEKSSINLIYIYIYIYWFCTVRKLKKIHRAGGRKREFTLIHPMNYYSWSTLLYNAWNLIKILLNGFSRSLSILFRWHLHAINFKRKNLLQFLCGFLLILHLHHLWYPAYMRVWISFEILRKLYNLSGLGIFYRKISKVIQLIILLWR